MSDWQVVEEALTSLQNSGDRPGMYAEGENALAALARLREREAQLERAGFATLDALKAAEARVQELEARWQEQEHPFDKPEFDRMAARVEELEAALRSIEQIASDDLKANLARRALEPSGP